MPAEPLDPFDALLDLGGSQADFARRLFELTVEHAAADDEELPALLRMAFLPRQIDPDVVGVLRGDPDDHERNRELFAALSTFSFALTRSDGQVVYHDQTRDMLLAEWLTTDDPIRQWEFDDCNARLAAHHVQRYLAAETMRADLRHLRQLLKSANRTRYAELRAMVRDVLLASLLEALYHETLRSAQGGYETLVSYLERFEDEEDAAACSSLVSAYKETLAARPQDDEAVALARWVRYWEIRIATLGGADPEVQEQRLRDFLVESEDDVKLTIWALVDLGLLLQGQQRLQEAREILEEETRLASTTNVDVWNVAASRLRLGDLNLTLDDAPTASRHYRQAHTLALRLGNVRIEYQALLGLSAALMLDGRLPAARDAVLDALDIARTNRASDSRIHYDVAFALMEVYARHDAGLAETAYREARCMLPNADQPEARAALDLRYATVLSGMRLHDRALEILGRYAEEGETLGAEVVTDWHCTVGDIRFAKGDLAGALQAYSESVKRCEDGSGTDQLLAAALLGRGSVRLDQGEWDTAHEDLARARAMLEAAGRDRAADSVGSTMANVLRSRGDLGGAHELLHAIRTKLVGVKHLAATYFESEGELHDAAGRWAEAAESHRNAARTYRSLGDWSYAARAYAAAAKAAGDASDLAGARADAGAAARFWARCARLTAWTPDPVTREADVRSAEAVRLLAESAANEDDDLRRSAKETLARTADRSANMQHHLNLSYACEALEDWPEAVAAMEAVLEHAPRELASPRFRERLGSLRLRHAAALRAAGRPGDAADVIASVTAQRGLSSGLRGEACRQSIDTLIALGRHDEAAVVARDALGTRAAAPWQAQFRGKLAYLNARVWDVESALAVLRPLGAAQEADLRAATAAFAGQVADARDALAVAEVLRAWCEEGELSPPLVEALIEARFEHAERAYEGALGRLEDLAGVDMDAATSALRLSTHPEVFPARDEALRERFLSTDLPHVRERIRGDTGINMRSVRITFDDRHGPGGFEVSVLDVVRARGEVVLDRLFCSDVEWCRAHGVDGSPVPGPDGRTAGFWLEGADWAAAEDAGQVLLDPQEFVAGALESVVRSELWTTVVVDDLVEQTSAPPDDPALRVRATWLARNLLRAGVRPDGPDLVQRLSTAPDGDVDTLLWQLVEEARDGRRR